MKHIKKIDEIVGFGMESEQNFPNRTENAFRNKMDKAMLYFLTNENKINLDNLTPVLGDEKYQDFFIDLIEVCKKHKRFK